MTIKTITFAGVDGDVEITRNDRGAFAMANEICIAAFERNEDSEARFYKGLEVAKAIYGVDRIGRAKATHSMIYDVLREIERLAD